VIIFLKRKELIALLKVEKRNLKLLVTLNEDGAQK